MYIYIYGGFLKWRSPQVTIGFNNYNGHSWFGNIHIRSHEHQVRSSGKLLRLNRLISPQFNQHLLELGAHVASAAFVLIDEFAVDSDMKRFSCPSMLLRLGSSGTLPTWVLHQDAVETPTFMLDMSHLQMGYFFNQTANKKSLGLNTIEIPLNSEIPLNYHFPILFLFFSHAFLVSFHLCLPRMQRKNAWPRPRQRCSKSGTQGQVRRCGHVLTRSRSHGAVMAIC